MTTCSAITSKNLKCKLKTKNDILCPKHFNMKKKGKNVGIYQINNDANVLLIPEPIINVPMIHDPIINDNEINDQIFLGHVSEDQTEIINELMIPVTDCMCCYDTYSNDNIILCTNSTLDNKHAICHTCMNFYIETLINGKNKIKCVNNNNCQGVYTDFDIITSLNERLLERYQEYVQVEQATRMASILDNYHLCPFCYKYGIIIENIPGYQQEHIKIINCLNSECKKTWCIYCRKAFHGNDPCNKINTYDIEVIKKTIDETIDSAIIHNCPKCFTKYNKEDGCNLMTCPSCGSHSCYVCNILITPINGQKYLHFSNAISIGEFFKCPLFNSKDTTNEENIKKGNVCFNEKKIINAMTNLIEINKDDPHIIQIINKYLVSKGYVQFTEKLSNKKSNKKKKIEYLIVK